MKSPKDMKEHIFEGIIKVFRMSGNYNKHQTF